MAGGAQEDLLARLAAVDRLIFSRDAFKLSAEEQAARQIEFVRTAAEHHYEHCALFREYAARLDFDPSDVNSVEGMALVPQLPTGVFKRTTVRSAADEEDMRRCTSSGTRGSLSVIWRDRETIQRLCGSIQSGIAEFLGDPYEEDVIVINLGPSEEEAGDLWLAYVLSLVELGYETRHMMTNGILDAPMAADAIVDACASAAMVVVIGAPSVMYEVAQACPCDRKTRHDKDVRVVAVTAGGWKRRNGTGVSRDALTKTVVEAFGIGDARDVRDTFNQVELNTVLFECEYAKKHVPPWLHAFTRDVRTLKRLPGGEVGLLSYLDPTARSYPAFIISDDLGAVDRGGCACGRPGATLSVARRIERDEHWGCALKVDELVARGRIEKWRSRGERTS
jgi:long-chain-fatty-acid---luciferin-component ligase